MFCFQQCIRLQLENKSCKILFNSLGVPSSCNKLTKVQRLSDMLTILSQALHLKYMKFWTRILKDKIEEKKKTIRKKTKNNVNTKHSRLILEKMMNAARNRDE